MQIKQRGKPDILVRIKPYREIGPALLPQRLRPGLPKEELTVRYEGKHYVIVSQDREGAYWWLAEKVAGKGAK